tara:strand:- start:22 stop:459 length:438 start_codon:yes stop_codon:yes gene_type:complete
MTEAIICDLDGTLSINDHGRSFFEAHDCDRDSLNEPVGRLLEWARECDIEIIYLSGREDRFREPTLRFLFENDFGHDIGIEPNEYSLFMRKTGDNRADDIIKWEIYQEHIEPNYNIVFILDDRNQVVNMWRSKGLTCFQVAPGDF